MNINMNSKNNVVVYEGKRDITISTHVCSRSCYNLPKTAWVSMLFGIQCDWVQTLKVFKKYYKRM